MNPIATATLLAALGLAVAVAPTLVRRSPGAGILSLDALIARGMRRQG